MYATNADRSEKGWEAVTRTLLLREAIVLAEVPEKRVRKDIETGLLNPPWIFKLANDREKRLCMHWSYVFTLAAVYGNELLTSRLRKVALDKLYTFYKHERAEVQDGCATGCYISHPSCDHVTINLDKYIALKMDKVCENVKPRVYLYAEGLSRIEEKEGIIGGEAVFRETRLSVRHIGRLYDRGEKIETILEDYPYLSDRDVKFARLYYRAHPPVGRPRASVEADS